MQYTLTRPHQYLPTDRFDGFGTPNNPRRRPAPPRAPRRCLGGCDRMFASAGPDNRICPRCAARNAAVPRLGGSPRSITWFDDDDRD